MKRKMKSFRLKESTIQELTEIKKYYDKWAPDLEITETDIVTLAINSMYWHLVNTGDIE